MRRYIGKKTVPNVKGMTAKDAVYLIENTGMVAKVSGYGKVVEQSLAPGVQAYGGGVVEIKLK
jgi:cell division protein FtsI (penicillin-binding protein 3)